MASMRRSTTGSLWLAFLCLETSLIMLFTWRPKEWVLDCTFSQCPVQICSMPWRQSLLTLPIKRMSCGYQEFTTISQWSPWTELSSGLSTSCATKEPSTFVWQHTTSPGSSTTLWTWLDSCLAVWWLWSSSPQSAVSFVVRSLVALEKRKGSNWGGENRHMDLLQCITARETFQDFLHFNWLGHYHSISAFSIILGLSKVPFPLTCKVYMPDNTTNYFSPKSTDLIWYTNSEISPQLTICVLDFL